MLYTIDTEIIDFKVINVLDYIHQISDITVTLYSEEKNNLVMALHFFNALPDLIC